MSDETKGWMAELLYEDCARILDICPDGVSRLLAAARAGEKMPFEPRITTEKSRVNPDQLAWIFHFPDGSSEVGGSVGVVARPIAIELYVKRLSRVGCLCDPSDVKADIPPSQLTPPKSDTRKQWEIVLDALENGAVTSFDIARDTGMSPGPVAAILTQQLEAKGRAHRVGHSAGKGKSLTWAPGPAPANNPTVEAEPAASLRAEVPIEYVLANPKPDLPPLIAPTTAPSPKVIRVTDFHKVTVPLKIGGVVELSFGNYIHKYPLTETG